MLTRSHPSHGDSRWKTARPARTLMKPARRPADDSTVTPSIRLSGNGLPLPQCAAAGKAECVSTRPTDS